MSDEVNLSLVTITSYLSQEVGVAELRAPDPEGTETDEGNDGQCQRRRGGSHVCVVLVGDYDSGECRRQCAGYHHHGEVGLGHLEQQTHYQNLLNISGNGIMGYIEVPKIDIVYPLYHGTDEAVLQIAIGHLDWTSLPVGGEGSHCVVSGHRGLPSARLFTDLDQMEVGDTFLLRVLDEVLTYEVDQIKIVEPQVTEDLLIVEGQDLCTLITCTPYGINSHRMLVRGHRIATEEVKAVRRVTADAVQIEPVIVAPFVAAPMLLILLVALLLPKSKKRKEN